MNRFSRPLLASALTLALMGLLAALLSLPAGALAGPAGPRAAATIRVPVDYPTIQAAIDAAQAGDTILVAAATYNENLSVTEGITLSGGWNITFTEQSPGNSWIDAGGLGRGISITCAASATVVTIDGFTVMHGDATGLGGAAAQQPAIATTAPARSADALGLAERADAARAQLARLYAGGHWPGDTASYRDTLQRLERWVGVASQAAQESGTKTNAATVTPAAAGTEADCGGGIYVHNARLRLTNSLVAENVASTAGAGNGGGICVVGAPADGFFMDNTVVLKNIAGTAGPGAGGGVYIAQSDPDSVTIRRSVMQSNLASRSSQGQGGGLAIEDVGTPAVQDTIFFDNVASRSDAGQGGGLYLSNADQATLSGNDFWQNAATSGAASGRGGGLYVESGQGLAIVHNTFRDNTANSAWDAEEAIGGGACLSNLRDSRFEDNTVEHNLAGVHALSRGGGLAAIGGQDLRIIDNTITVNWGALFQLPNMAAGGVTDGGGGVYIFHVMPVTISSNLVADNVAVIDTVLPKTAGFGGGVLLISENVVVTDNTFAGNVAALSAAGFGGGLSAFGSRDIIMRTNVFTGNVGTAHGLATGGGADVRECRRVLVQRNRFENNTASMDDDGSGGGLMMGGLPDDNGLLTSHDMTVDASLFLRNAASRRGWPADGYGGGLFLYLTQGFTVTNNIAAANLGGMTVLGSYASPVELASGIMANNTLAGNGAVGLVLSGWYTVPARLVNNIVTSHTVAIEVQDGNSHVEMNYTLSNGNGTDVTAPGSQVTNTHVVTGLPAFLNPAADDYHLTVASAARNAGDPTGVPPAPDHDADGVKRPFGARVDIGAYEWRGPVLYLPFIADRASGPSVTLNNRSGEAQPAPVNANRRAK